MESKNPEYIQIYKDSKPFPEYKMTVPYLLLPLKPSTSKAAIGFEKSILKNFFGIQYARRLHLNKIPIKNVSHPLDAKVPFCPEKIAVYTDFVGFFMRIFHFIMKTFPKKEAAAISNEFFSYLKNLYVQAGTIYKVTLTTTKRPFYIKSSRFLIIHMFDPHYMCIPSLHVAIVCCTFAFLRKMLSEHKDKFSEDQQKNMLTQVYSGALSITESVLFVKQHSINCLAAAMYMLTAVLPENMWTSEDAKDFSLKLFTYSTEIEQSQKDALRTYLFNLYTTFLDAHQEQLAISDENTIIDWREPILNWLKDYKNQ